jgi:hypothetical protein
MEIHMDQDFKTQQDMDQQLKHHLAKVKIVQQDQQLLQGHLLKLLMPLLEVLEQEQVPPSHHLQELE